MLWHGSGTAVAGVGRQPVSVGTLPRECQPLNRVLAWVDTDRRLRQAGGVPTDPSPRRRGLGWLPRPRGDGGAALAAAAPRRRRSTCCPGSPACGRGRAPSTPVPRWSWPGCGPRARPVFGGDADVLFLTADALEQAGRPELAARQAARLLAGGAARVADLGLRATGARCHARWPGPGPPWSPSTATRSRRALTAANVEALGVADRVRGRRRRRRRPGGRGRGRSRGATRPRWTRRAGRGGRRLLDPSSGPRRGRRWRRSWTACRVGASRWRRAWTTTASPTAWRRSGSSVGGSIVEALLWGRGRRRPGAGPPSSATASSRSSPPTPTPGPAPVGPVRGVAARARPAPSSGPAWSPTVGRRLGATLIDPTIAYLTSDAAADSPGSRSYRVDEVLPFSLKRLQGPAAGAGRRTGRRQEAAGHPIEPEALRRQLRGPGSGSAVVVVTRRGRRARPCWCASRCGCRRPARLSPAQRVTTSWAASCRRRGPDPTARPRRPRAASPAPPPSPRCRCTAAGWAPAATMPAVAQRSSAERAQPGVGRHTAAEHQVVDAVVAAGARRPWR